MGKLRSLLITELVREHEQNFGPLADNEVVAKIVAKGGLFHQQVQQRAAALAAEHALQTPVEQLYRVRFWLLMSLGVIALLFGVAIARTALAGGSPLSISAVLWVLLAPTTLALLFWLVLLVFGNQGGGVGGKLLTHLATHWPQQVLARSLATWLQLADRHKVLKPYFSLLSHSFWLLVGLISMLTLWLLLVFQQYHFYWATTLLSTTQLEQIVAALAWLPSMLGVTPPEGVIMAASRANELSDSATLTPSALLNHSEVGRWLLALVLVYGVLPRLLLALISAAWLTVALQRAELDEHASGIANLRARFAPTSSPASVVDADGKIAEVRLRKGQPKHFGRGELVVSLDYEKEPDWNHTLWLNNAGVVASSNERSALLADLANNIPARIVVRINSQLSPDRGSIRFILRLQESCGALAAWMVGQGPYAEHWQEALAEIEVQLFTLDEEVVRWSRGTQL